MVVGGFERKGRSGDEGQELGAGVGWEVNMWNTGLEKEVRTGGGDNENGCKARYLDLVSAKGYWRQIERVVLSLPSVPMLVVGSAQLLAGDQFCQRPK